MKVTGNILLILAGVFLCIAVGVAISRASANVDTAEVAGRVAQLLFWQKAFALGSLVSFAGGIFLFVVTRTPPDGGEA
jgi:hypothetical protein